MRRGHRGLQQLAAPRELLLPHTISQKAIVPDVLEPTRQDVEEKAADEFDRVQGHDPLAIPSGVIPPAKRHPARLQGEEPPVRDRHTMGVAGEVFEHVRWLAHRTLGVDHPLMLVQPLHEVLPGLWLGQRLTRAGQCQRLRGHGLREPLEKAAPKEPT